MATRADYNLFTLPTFALDETAPCSETDPELFFPQEYEVGGVVYSKYTNLSAAKQICNSCPLRVQCLEYAMATRPIGVWGGTTEAQRDNLKRSMRRAANRRMPASPLDL